jgi:hypothetical protein
MRTQLLKRPVDHRHADELAAALALPEYLDRDRLGVGTRSVCAGIGPRRVIRSRMRNASGPRRAVFPLCCNVSRLLSTLGIYPLVAPNIGRCMYGNGRLGRSSYVLTLTTYADYIPEQETENPLSEPVAAVPDTNVVKLFG